MKRVLAVVWLAALTACGATPSATPAGTPTASSTTRLVPPGITRPTPPLARPVVTRLTATLDLGVGRSAAIDGATNILAGGLVLGDGTTDVVQQFDPATGTVHRLPALAVPVHDTAGAALSSGPIVIGGGNTSEQSVVQKFVGGKWTVVGHLPTTRSDLSAAQVHGITYVLGGYDGSTPAVATVLSTNDGSTWGPAGRLAVPVRYAAAAAYDAKIWLFGGEVSNVQQDTIQVFEPGNGKGHVVAHLPEALGHMSAYAIGDRILILGGRTNQDTMSDRMWWFDTSTSKLTDAGTLPYPVADASLVAGTHSDKSIYLLGGESPHPIATILKIQVNP